MPSHVSDADRNTQTHDCGGWVNPNLNSHNDKAVIGGVYKPTEQNQMEPLCSCLCNLCLAGCMNLIPFRKRKTVLLRKKRKKRKEPMTELLPRHYRGRINYALKFLWVQGRSHWSCSVTTFMLQTQL